MATKRKAQEAFSKRQQRGSVKKLAPATQVSAFAAARARSQHTSVAAIPAHDVEVDLDTRKQSQDDQRSRTTDQSDHDIIRSQHELDKLDIPIDLPTIPPSTSRGIDFQLASVKLPTGRSQGAQADSITLKLSQDAFVTPVGEYQLEVTAGSVSLYGATLHVKSGPQRVYALSTHAIPQIVARSAETEIRISSIPSLANKLEKLSPLFRNISSGNSSSPSFTLLERSSQDMLQRSLVPIETTKQHQVVLAQLAMKSETNRGRVAIACIGGKSTGKSTFARHVCNKLLTRASHKRCLYLDLDPGQPEFGPPGQVYLVEVLAPIVGPSYTHFASRGSKQYRLLAAHTIAATSFKDDPQHYMDCIAALFNDKRLVSARRDGNCPLVVNTCGWTTGLGAKVLTDILGFGITDAVLIDVADTSIVERVRARSEQCFEFERPSTRFSSRSPAELRQMQVMAYFHTRSQRSTDPEASVRLAEKPIAQWRPWLVSYDKQPGCITAIASYGHAVNPDFLAEVIDGSIMAIVTTPEDSILGDAKPADSNRGSINYTPEGLPYLSDSRPLDPRHSQYIGLVLLRGIDTASRQLHFLTPLDEEEIVDLMQQTTVLVRGTFDSPDWAYLEDVFTSTTTEHSIERPWLAKRESVGVEGAVWRLRHPPMAPRTGMRP